MEKQGVVDEKNTRPETPEPAKGEKKAEADLTQHTTKRLSDSIENPKRQDKKS